jgi:hypothetical protein
MIKQVTDGVEKDSGSIFARNVLLVAQPDGSAVLVGTFVNEGATPDVLASMSINGAALKFDKPSYALAQNKPLIFSGDTANAHAVITGLNASPGDRVNLVITYGTTPSITMNVLVREKDAIYANVG